MTDSTAAVLQQVDRDLEKSLDRLFAFLRIPRVSAQPKHAETGELHGDLMGLPVATLHRLLADKGCERDRIRENLLF